MILAVGLQYMAFMMLKYIPSIPTLLRVFFKSRMDAVLCQVLFLHLLTESYGSYPFLVNAVYITLTDL